MENHVHVRTKSQSSKNPGGGGGGSSPPKMGYEKAARRLRTIILRSSRLGLTACDIAGLPGARRLYTRRGDHGWKISVLIVVIIGAALAVALLCTAGRRKCFRIEDITGEKMENCDEEDLPVKIKSSSLESIF